MAIAEGLLAVGGDLSVDRLVLAYSQGIFPWYAEDDPILWWSPDPRLILYPEELHVSRSLRKPLRRRTFAVTLDRAFHRVIRACAGSRGPDHPGTWIVPEMVAAYESLHGAGLAHSVEAWDGDTLAGGCTASPWAMFFSANPCFLGSAMHRKWPWCTWWRGCGGPGSTWSTARSPPSTSCVSAPGKFPDLDS